MALTPWSEALGGERPSAWAAFGAALGGASGVAMAGVGLLGGFLVEAFAGAVVGVLVAVLAPGLAPASGRRRALLGGLGIVGVLWGSLAGLLAWPEVVRGAAPWLAGGAMVVGLGSLAGRRGAGPRRDWRATGALGTLLLGNWLGPPGLLALPAFGALGRLRGGGRWARALLILLALATWGLMAWFPYRLPSQVQPLIPASQEAIGPASAALLGPLAFLGGQLAAALRRPRWGLVVLLPLAGLLLSGR